MLAGDRALDPAFSDWFVTFPKRNPASCNASVALPNGWPTKLGMTKACGCAGSLTSKLIFGAETLLAFSGGA